MSTEWTVDGLRRSSMPPQLRDRDCTGRAVYCALSVARFDDRVVTPLEACAQSPVPGLLVALHKAVEQIISGTLGRIEFALEYAHSSTQDSCRQMRMIHELRVHFQVSTDAACVIDILSRAEGFRHLSIAFAPIGGDALYTTS